VLPVANYETNIKIVPLDLDSTIVKWQANFDPLTPDADAVISSIFRAGLDTLKADLEGRAAVS